MQDVDVVENVTGSPESDVALTVKLVAGVGGGNVIVCGAPVTAKDTEAVAAAYCALPLCEAVSPQEPMVSRLTVEPPTEQTVGVVDEKVIGNPLGDDATSASLVNVAPDAGVVNVMVCESTPIEKDWLTAVAAAYTVLPDCVA